MLFLILLKMNTRIEKIEKEIKNAHASEPQGDIREFCERFKGFDHKDSLHKWAIHQWEKYPILLEDIEKCAYILHDRFLPELEKEQKLHHVFLKYANIPPAEKCLILKEGEGECEKKRQEEIKH